MPRVIFASNRLSHTARITEHGVDIVASSGGLATALAGAHARAETLWLGWPGDLSEATPEQREEVDRQLRDRRAVAVHLSREQVARYYDGFSNAVLWPLFHYALDKVQLDADADWQVYQEVNARFADAIAEQWREGDLVWVHDYQLSLVPELVRRRLPAARIGYFLHIPFPAGDVFRLLPWREEILRGVMGADLVGFQTASYRSNFCRAAALVLGVDLDVDQLVLGDRRVEVGVFPISIDVPTFAADTTEITAELAALRAEAPARKLVVGIDRLDYTKGILRRLHAFDRLLSREPELASLVKLVQIAVPSREGVDAYGDLRAQANELVGRINARHGTHSTTPVHFLYRSIPQHELIALYRAADVMLVTPLRDGMNLVAKEYCAARLDARGVLILSELAGAADELTEALIVNPYDVGALERTLRAALAMPEHEQRARMVRMRQRVLDHDVHRWCDSFLERLGALPVPAPPDTLPPTDSDTLGAQLVHLAASRRRMLLLDYDGTLVPFAALPELAVMDAPLRQLLARLAAQPGTDVHVVTGRSPSSIGALLGDLPVGIHAEHGYWSRSADRERWVVRHDGPLAWKRPVLALMAALVARTPGALLEEKTCSVAFHYRGADPTLAVLRVAELVRHMRELRLGEVALLEGHKVLEARLRGVDKGLAARAALADASADTAVLAIGDDRTDEDLFAALPAGAITIHVGPGRSRARHHLRGPAEVRAILGALLEDRA
jgi:trehalose 6-phosphate synthase/phosphatase